MSRAERRAMVERENSVLPVSQQCRLLAVPRASVYRQPAEVSAEDLAIMARIDRRYLARPYYGSRRMAAWLASQGHGVNRKRVQRLMRRLGLVAIYQRPNTSKPAAAHKIYPYLLGGLAIERVNQVWCSDVTYIAMAKGFLYRVVIIDWASRAVLAWRLSNTLGADFCVEALEEALVRYGRPEIFNTDQGSQFTSDDFTGILKRHEVTISMDGRGRCIDNIFVERLWRSLKYEEVYLHAYANVAEARAGIGAWLHFYNEERQHQSFGYRTPRQIYQEGLWIWGRSALPTGCASPASRAGSESGERLAFAPIPTAATANEGFDIDAVKGSIAAPANPITATAADIETGRATP
jgi:putative transposase